MADMMAEKVTRRNSEYDREKYSIASPIILEHFILKQRKNTMITKKVSLNKAAVLMKKAKQKQQLMSALNFVVLYPIDAIGAQNPEQIRKQIVDKVATVKQMAVETKDAIMFYTMIKEKLIQANVESGLHVVLCQLDMLKNMKQYFEMILHYDASKTVQNAAHNTKGVSYVLIDEDTVSQSIVFNKFIDTVISDIVRPDSKTNFINAIVDIESMSEATIKKAMVELQKAVNELEDKKYEINNTKKIEIDIPDSLIDYLGF
jgi:hypothetical protein